jgi:hypothetical protein
LDSGLQPSPLAATYSYNLVNQEQGLNDNETATTTALTPTFLPQSLTLVTAITLVLCGASFLI